MMHWNQFYKLQGQTTQNSKTNTSSTMATYVSFPSCLHQINMLKINTSQVHANNDILNKHTLTHTYTHTYTCTHTHTHTHTLKVS